MAIGLYNHSLNQEWLTGHMIQGDDVTVNLRAHSKCVCEEDSVCFTLQHFF